MTERMTPEQLVDAVAGLLLLSRALAPRRRVYLRERLRALGTGADHSDIFCAVQKLRRRYGWVYLGRGALLEGQGHRGDAAAEVVEGVERGGGDGGAEFVLAVSLLKLTKLCREAAHLRPFLLSM